MEIDFAYSLIASAIDSGRPANGYLVVGDLDLCEELTDRVLDKLFPDPDAQLQLHGDGHPDVRFLRPSGKARQIKIEKSATDPAPGMRDGMIEPMSTTAYSGGWKVGVIVAADRMNENAANAFLKILEEPPRKTLFILQTEMPDGMLPTIVSRTQRIDLRLSEGALVGEPAAAVAEVFSARDVKGVFAKSRQAARLFEIYRGLKDEAEEDEDVGPLRQRFFRTLIKNARRWLVDEAVPRQYALANIEAIETAFRRLEKCHLPEEAVFAGMTDVMVWPT